MIFLIYKEIQNRAVAKSDMTYRLLMHIWWNICAFPHILGSPSSYIWLCNCSILNFLIYEENLIFFFISVRLGYKIVRGQRLEMIKAGMEAVILCDIKYRYKPGQNEENCFFLLQIHELQYGPDVLLQTVITCFWEIAAKQKNKVIWCTVKNVYTKLWKIPVPCR